jgi:hypothetical protein
MKENGIKRRKKKEKTESERKKRGHDSHHFAAPRFPAPSSMRCTYQVLGRSSHLSHCFYTKLRHAPIGELVLSSEWDIRVYSLRPPFFSVLCRRIMGCFSLFLPRQHRRTMGLAESRAIYFAGPDLPALRHSLLTYPLPLSCQGSLSQQNWFALAK